MGKEEGESGSCCGCVVLPVSRIKVNGADIVLPQNPLNPAWLIRAVRGHHVSFYLAAAYLFFEYVRPQTIYPVIDVLPWAAFFAVAALLTSFVGRSEYRFREDRLGKIILTFGLVVVISSIFSVDRSQSFSDLDVFFSWVVIYFAIVRSVIGRLRFYIFLLLYLLCNLKMTQHGFFSWAGRGFSFDSWGVVGGPGWFHNSGEFGIQLCIFAPLSFFFARALWGGATKLGRAFLLFMPMTAMLSVIASSSRGAVLGLGVGIGWAVRHIRRAVLILMIGAVVGAVFLVFMPPEFRERFESMGEDRTSLHRLDRWGKAWNTLAERPVFGVGHSAWVPYYTENLLYGERGSPLVHNMFIQCAVELGFVGLAVFVMLVIRMFVVLRETGLAGRELSDSFSVNIAAGLEVGLVGMLISSMFITVLYYPYVWIHAAFVTAFAQSCRPEKQ